ncbi:MAG: acyltransferase, partial [Actinomycetota bacterium]
YHGGLPGVDGALLGVSMFFTLSGFLITSLLLRQQATGGIDLMAFWGSRFRRLLPVALLGIALAIAVAASQGSAGVLRDLRGDVLGAIAYLANWRFAASGEVYVDLFVEPSPLLHYWSLAIEEQFYLLYPLVMAAAFRWSRHRRHAVPIVLACLAGASVVATLALASGGASDDRIYYGTDTRLFEVVAGAGLAYAVSRVPDLAERHWVRPFGVVVGVLLLIAWTSVDLTSPFLYDGGLAVYALLTTGVIFAASATSGPLVAVLSVEPLRALGRISYGTYVYHWPIFLWLDENRVDLDRFPLFLLRTAVTLVVAIASYHLIEMPIRERRFLVGLKGVVVAPAAAV